MIAISYGPSIFMPPLNVINHCISKTIPRSACPISKWHPEATDDLRVVTGVPHGQLASHASASSCPLRRWQRSPHHPPRWYSFQQQWLQRPPDKWHHVRVQGSNGSQPTPNRRPTWRCELVVAGCRNKMRSWSK